MKIKTKSKFFKVINNKFNLLEQGPVDDLSVQAQPGEEVVAAQQTETIKEPEPEVQKLTSEGELDLIRLVRDALQMDIQAGKIPSSILDPEINQKNGRDILSKIKQFMNTYGGRSDDSVYYP